MIERRTGHVATVTSLCGIYPVPHSLAYCGTKFGSTGFMQSLIEYLRMEKLDDVIHATIILPDVMSTRADIIEAVNSR